MRKSRHGSALKANLLRLLLYVALGAVLLWFFMPSSEPQSDSSPEEIAAAMAEAQADVDKAMALPDDFSREGAILDIRHRESRLRKAGFSVAADSFAAAAKRRLEYHGVSFNE